MKYHKIAYLIIVSVILSLSVSMNCFAEKLYFGDVKLSVEIPDNYYVVSSYGVSDASREALEGKGLNIDDLIKENRDNGWLLQATKDTNSVTFTMSTAPSNGESIDNVTEIDLKELEGIFIESFKSNGKEFKKVSKHETKNLTFLKVEYLAPIQGVMYEAIDYACIERGTGYYSTFLFLNTEHEAGDKQEIEEIINSVRIQGIEKKEKETTSAAISNSTENANDNSTVESQENRNYSSNNGLYLILYNICSAIGYNFVFLLITLAAVFFKTVKHKIKWGIFLVGLALQLMVEFPCGNTSPPTAEMVEMQSYNVTITVVIAILGVLILLRQAHKKDILEPDERTDISYSDTDKVGIRQSEPEILETHVEEESDLEPEDQEDEEIIMEENNEGMEELNQSYIETVQFFDLAENVAEFYEPVYQPEDYCDNAYTYCRKQYGTEDKKKLVFEYCMTSFYGAICTVALLHENQEQFKDQKAWDVLYRQINVEFTDANADRLMGTKQGEEKSERIFSIISMFFNKAYPVIEASDFKEEVCKHAMHMAYKLGMMVARKEFSIPDCAIVHEELPQSTDDEDEDGDEVTSAEIKSPQEFYKDCLKAFHEIGADAGYVKHGVIFIPELMPIGERIVKEFLKDPFFISEYGNDPVQYYYAIVGLSLQAGIVIADKWHTNYSELKNGFVDEVITDGPAEIAEELMENNFNVNAVKANEYYSSIFTKWMQLHHPYWNLKDPRQYTFLGTLAAYQVGISTILGKYGF